MAIYNNNVMTIGIIENEQQTYAVFKTWLEFMSKFKLEFEVRRIVFGLLALLRVPPANLPQIV